MDREARALAAVEILKVHGHGGYEQLGKDELSGSADEIINSARDLLLAQIKEMLDELSALGFSNKEISEDIGFDPAAVCRAHGAGRLERHAEVMRNRSGYVSASSLQMGLPKLRALVDALRFYVPRARRERLQRATLKSALKPVEYCYAGAITDELEGGILAAVLH
ncbi:MAG TPA: hypothetical protein VKW06_06700, partial [Candidatus Angelobacter sp.]|nr:hypothetical protein [Candidatus Angelobacter sp.]